MPFSFLFAVRPLILPVAVAALALMAPACSSSRPAAHPGETDATDIARHKLQSKLLTRLTKLMEGNYSSATAASTDRTIQDRRLHLHRIWRNRDASAEGIYFYVEEAAAATTGKPDRQQIWLVRLRPLDDKVETVFYNLRGPRRFVGQWKNKNAFAGLTPDSLTVQAGCNIAFVQNGDGFRGVTEPRTCPTNKDGAQYATTDITFSPNQLVRWDRGFDGADRLVWGPIQGGIPYEREGKRAAPKSSDPPTPSKA